VPCKSLKWIPLSAEATPWRKYFSIETMDPDIDDATISRFMSVTGCNLQHARFLLEATNGNFQSAQQMYYGKLPLQLAWLSLGRSLPTLHQASGSAFLTQVARPSDTVTAAPVASAPVAPAANMPTPPRPVAPAARQQAQQQQQQHNGLIQAAARLPFRLLWAGLGVVGSVFRLGFAAAAYVGDRVLPPSLMAVARGTRQCALLKHPGIMRILVLRSCGPVCFSGSGCSHVTISATFLLQAIEPYPRMLAM
jgi:hypothetical protein